MISWASALRHMRSFDKDNNPVRFSVQFITLDKRRKTGGKIRQLENVSISGLRPSSPGTRHAQRKAETKGSRSPSHFTNGTLNLIHKESGNITKVHPRLIVKLNGEKIYL